MTETGRPGAGQTGRGTWRAVVAVVVLGLAQLLSSPCAAGLNEDQALRVTLSEEGVYRLSGADLAAVGVDLSMVNPDSLNIYYGGGRPLDDDGSPLEQVILARVRIVVEGGADGRLDGDDSILFYGQAVDRWERQDTTWTHHRHPYTGQNVYWLWTGGGQSAGRAIAQGAAPQANVTPRTTYTARIHGESEVSPVWVASGNIRSGRDWYWKELASGEGCEFTVVTRSPGTGGARLRLAGYVTDGEGSQNLLRVSWNGAVVGQAKWSGRDHHIAQFTAPAVPAGINELTATLFTGDRVLLDWFEIETGHELAADRGELTFDAPDTAGAFSYRVRGFGEAPRIFAASSHGLRELLGGHYESADGAVVFGDSAAVPGERYLVLTEARLRIPQSLEVVERPGLPRIQGAEYVVITHADFAEQARRLAAWRSADRRFGPAPTTAVVDVGDVYEQFSGGLLDPTAIRNFLHEAALTWSPSPRYVVLLGDGSYDYRDNAALGWGQWIPPYEDRESTYDDWYARVEGGDDRPDLALGRLPVQTPEQARVVVDKLIDYDREPEPGSWRGRVLLVADDTYNADLPLQLEPFFTADAESLATRYMPEGLDLDKLYLVEYPLDGRFKPLARDALVASINRGAILLTWVGHGNARVFAHEHIFTVSTDVAALANGRRLPFVYTAASQMGVFDDPLRDSVPEALIKWPAGGAIGMVAATRVGFHGSNMDLARRFHERLFRSGRTQVPVGQALLEAKRLSDANPENVRRYSLFGDPLTRLAIPELAIHLEAPDTLRALGIARVSGRVIDADGSPVAEFNGEARLQVFDSASRRRLSEQGETVAYERPGAPLYRGVVPVRAGRFSTDFPVPRDITYRGVRGRMSVSAWGSGSGAYGSLEDLVLSGTDPHAEPDGEGPQIQLGLVGQSFADGDFAPPNPVLRADLRDPSGINITGDVGHDIILTVDGARRAVTELYAAGEDFRQGEVQIPLGDLSAGRHRVEMEAWDTRNNWSVAAVSLTVGRTGEPAISDVLFHPGPMIRNGHFTFTLSAPAERLEITVFSVSGRRVARLSGAADIGYNQVAWQPAPVPAAGAYLYHILAIGADGGLAKATGALQIAP